MVDFQTISIIIAASSVILAMINAILSSRRASKNDRLALETRQMNNYLQFARQSQTKEFLSAYHEIVNHQWDDANEWHRKYGPMSNPEAYVKFSQICEFFNTIGLLVKTGIINENIPYQQGADAIIGIWRKVKPIVYSMRADAPGLYTTFEYFAVRCEQIREKEQTS
jgi:hypothetical protein